MKSWQIVHLVAGLFILLSLALGIPGSPIFVSQWWLAFTAFVGLNINSAADFGGQIRLLAHELDKTAVQPGDEIRSGADSPIKPGNSMQLRHVPIGTIGRRG